jgi:hypothetical protein
VHVLLDILASQSEAGADWSSRIFGINRMGKIRREDKAFKTVEIRHCTVRRWAEVGWFRQNTSLFVGQVVTQYTGSHLLPL